MLLERGALIVAVTDSRGGVYDQRGLDLDLIDGAKDAGRGVTDAEAGSPLDPTDLIGVECDIWIPAARGDNVNRLTAKLVVEAANVPTTHAADRHLQATDVVVLPDFVVNAGGVICGAVEYARGTRAAAFEAIDERIRSNVEELFHGGQHGAGLRSRARAIAQSRIEKASGLRRWV